MEFETGYCPHCKGEFTYNTQRNFIIHAPCKQRVEVEPCEPEPEPEVVEDGTDV